ncbi:DNA-binding protein [Methylobacterium sp. E-016]|uniref:DNA-binding protein n=1 Tax=Methylobacterium sp. E-016 TaxID=2836556 RepID=UPI001FBA9F61|nr:DNA-binding protein [Methylobacterium sp. E-016]MCJ2077662.1 DNA-binding protein [Methylobacterium sp. E-016]
MVDRVEVFRVADELRARRDKAVRVSVRRVRGELEKGGSYSDVGPVLADWKSVRNYQPVIELMELPRGLQSRLGAFGKALWDEVRAQESRLGDAERANFEIERSAYREMLDEASLTVDVLEARISALNTEIERLRGTGANGAAPLGTMAPQSEVWDRSAAIGELRQRRSKGEVPLGAQDAFWRSVEAEILGLVQKQGPMSAGDLLTALPQPLKDRGELVEMPLSAGWLGFRLRALSEPGGPFREMNGLFCSVGNNQVPAPNVVPTNAKEKRPPPSEGDDVMQAVRDILLQHGPMKPSQIGLRLSDETIEAAGRHWQGGLKRLAKNMGERASRGFYFVRVGGGRYGAKPMEAA